MKSQILRGMGAAFIGVYALLFMVNPVQAQNKPLSFGLTPVMIDTNYGLIERWLNYLSRKLGEKVIATQRRSYQEILTLMKYGVVDFAWVCGYPYVMNEKILQLIAVPRHLGKPLYQSFLIVHADSKYQNLGDLRGKIHAFSDIDSNSGHLVPRYILSRINTTPEVFFSTYFFTYSHENVIRSVAAGLSDSGSVDGYIWSAINESNSRLAGKTRIIHRSDYYGFPPIVSLKSFPAEKKMRIRNVFIEMKNDAEGVKILSELYLDGFTAEKSSLFDGIRKIKAKVENFQNQNVANN